MLEIWLIAFQLLSSQLYNGGFWQALLLLFSCWENGFSLWWKLLFVTDIIVPEWMPLYEIATIFKSLKITVKCTEGLGRLLILTCSALHELLLFIRLCYHEPWGRNYFFLMPTADKLSCDRLCLHSGFEWNEERNDWIYLKFCCFAEGWAAHAICTKRVIV